MALAKLYLVTGNKKYLDQAKFFLDARGYTSRKDAYSQAHKPVEQDEAVDMPYGLYVFRYGRCSSNHGDSSYIKAIDRFGIILFLRKFIHMGGIGARHSGELSATIMSYQSFRLL